MRWILTICALSTVQFLFAESTISGVKTSLVCAEGEYFVQQDLMVELDDTLSYFDLKALIFEGTEIKYIDVSFGRENGSKDEVMSPVDYEALNSSGITHLRISNKPKKVALIRLQYALRISKDVFYVPLFFTDFGAASSDNDFFRMNIQYAETANYHLHFPTVPISTENQDGTLISQFELPALASMIRMERLEDSNERVNYVNIIDGSVALAFVIVGFLIWYYRKQLIYG